MTQDEFIEFLEKKFPAEKVEVLQFEKMFSPVKYRCLSCNKIYLLDRANRVYVKKYLCWNCAIKAEPSRSKMKEWIGKFFQTTQQFILQDWDGSSKSYLTIYCKNCNRSFQKLAYNLYKKEEDTICPNCGKNGMRVDEVEYTRRMEQIFGKDEYEILDYTSTLKRAIFRHKCGFVFSQIARNFLKGRGCPQCFHTISKGELRVRAFLDKHQIEYETQKHFQELWKLSYDFFLPSYRLLIEYQGQQHYFPVEIFGGKVRYSSQKHYDEIKAEYAKQHNFILLTISYKDYKKIDDILSSVLFGSTTNKKE